MSRFVCLAESVSYFGPRMREMYTFTVRDTCANRAFEFTLRKSDSGYAVHAGGNIQIVRTRDRDVAFAKAIQMVLDNKY